MAKSADSKMLTVRIPRHLYEAAFLLSLATGQPVRQFVEDGLQQAIADRIQSGGGELQSRLESYGSVAFSAVKS